MDHLDEFEQIAFEATYSAGLLGNGTEFELVDIPLKSLSEQIARWQSNNFGFIGIIGIVDGKPKVALALPLDDTTISALTAAFVQRIESALIAFEKAVIGDSAQFLHRLHALPDTREN